MVFRYQPDAKKTPWISEIVLVMLDQDFELTDELQLLDVRKFNPEIPTRTEDPRIIACNEKIYIIYNDNLEETLGPPSNTREIYIVEVIVLEDGKYDCKKPVLLRHPINYPSKLAEKNWTPFIYNNQLLLQYTVKPQEILLPDLETGECTTLYKIDYELPLNRDFTWNDLRGGTPPILEKDTYLALFHSFKIASSNIAKEKIHHYFMGAYTFSATPPFLINAVSPMPIVGDGFYFSSKFNKRVVYPGGIIQAKNRIYVLYGSDDKFVHVAILDKEKLLESLRPVSYNYIMPEDFFPAEI